jgi:hypothetical protein
MVIAFSLGRPVLSNNCFWWQWYTGSLRFVSSLSHLGSESRGWTCFSISQTRFSNDIVVAYAVSEISSRLAIFRW